MRVSLLYLPTPIITHTFCLSVHPPVDLPEVIQKEALYCALGRCSIRLRDVIPFEKWLQETLVSEARETNQKFVNPFDSFSSLTRGQQLPDNQAENSLAYCEMGLGFVHFSKQSFDLEDSVASVNRSSARDRCCRPTHGSRCNRRLC